MRFILSLSLSIIALFGVNSVVARSQFTLPYEAFVPNTPILNTEKPKPSKPQQVDKQDLFLQLTISKLVYRLGENMSIRIKSNHDCYLTVLDFSTSGNANVLYPNKYQQNNFIQANSAVTIPNRNFEIKIAGATGIERLWAYCSLDKRPLFDINYNFHKSIFTSLGKVSNFTAKHTIPPAFNAQKEIWVKAQITIKQ